MEEPEVGSVPINLPIIRNAGTLGNVTVEWVATIDGHPADADLQVASGNITFAPGEAIQMLVLEIIADDIPEIEEVSTAVKTLLNKEFKLVTEMCANQNRRCSVSKVQEVQILFCL